MRLQPRSPCTGLEGLDRRLGIRRASRGTDLDRKPIAHAGQAGQANTGVFGPDVIQQRDQVRFRNLPKPQPAGDQRRRGIDLAEPTLQHPLRHRPGRTPEPGSPDWG